ncbi:SCO1664 family protein [Kineococcus sp. R8]|uniref:SCO1664 family protein n=1 Tax=Kineococcus siccus TaxID=2696567 RepID=UPI0014128F86|nr:SCO1664 family protein [Kineococcus siccus]NAZ81510.1 SCO1664 family protein [Kineococcus siccus]
MTEAEALDRLATGELVIRGRLADASNATLYAVAAGEWGEVACVYKPVSGERPLWDFPDDTLARREVSSYAVSAATGWDVVPPTVFRDGPLGPGSVQLWLAREPARDDDPEAGVDAAEEAAAAEDVEEVVLPEPGAGLIDICSVRRVPPGWLTVLTAEDGRGRPVALVHADDLRLRRMAVLDVVLNNADRKGGHVLPGWGGAVHGVDHGLTFHGEPKLRTVLWGFGGTRLLAQEREVLARLAQDLGDRLGEVLTDLLSVEEVVATLERVERLLAADRLPRARGGNPIPWPPF